MGLIEHLRSWADSTRRFFGKSRASAPGRSHLVDQRTTLRVPVDLHVKMQFESEAEAARSRALDISEGGVFLATSSPREESTVVHLHLEIGGRALTARGIVVRCVRPPEPGQPHRQKPGMGVVFTDLDDEMRTAIAAMAAARV